MKALTTKEILDKYLNFFENKDHKLVPNVSLIPEGDSTLLFVNSGMFPLVPYLMGKKHPLGTRIMNVQRSFRTDDIEEAGITNRHTTSFHMIGNWSLGDYFKQEQLNWFYTFLTEEIKLDPKRLYVTVFEGDNTVKVKKDNLIQPLTKDVESISIWQKIFNTTKDAKKGVEGFDENIKIYTYPSKKNWWSRAGTPEQMPIGEIGGADSEVFYDTGAENKLHESSEYKDKPCHINCDCGRFLEIGNSVFMEYKKVTQNVLEPLPNKNVDFGGGLERFALIVQNKTDIFETDNFWPIIEKIQELSGKNYYENWNTKKAFRIVADHIRAATFLAMDGLIPSNKDQGYFLRRLIRRMVRFGKQININKDISVNLVPTIANNFEWIYPELKQKQQNIQKMFAEEEEKFRRTLNKAEKDVRNLIDTIQSKNLSEEQIAVEIFNLYQSQGYPVEMIIEDLRDSKVVFNENELLRFYKQKIEVHQNISRTGAEQKFKGGLADSSTEVIKYHTATHLLQQALKELINKNIRQKGSNNTKERLRFDFNLDRPLSDNEVKMVESKVNEIINLNLPINKIELSIEDALNTGAYYLENAKYPDKVFIYFIGDDLKSAYSKEFCGGPHVENTGELGKFKITKEEAVSKGIRRIKAILE